MKITLPFVQNIFLLAAAPSLVACKDSIFAPARNYNLEVTEPGRDSIFVIENRKNTAFIHFSFAGQLSHNVKIQWSPDSSFKYPTEYKIPAGQILMPVQTSDYYSEKVYVKYLPETNSTSGKLRINVKI